jgi:hypothetical protein
MSAIVLTTHDNNGGGAICLPGQSGPQCSFTGISPSRQPDFTQITYEYTGPVDWYDWPETQRPANEPPSGCGIGLTESPCHPPDNSHSVPGPATLPLMVLGVALVGWLHRRVVR